MGSDISARSLAILFGIIAALGYGAADFLARFSAERLGVRSALLGMLGSGAVAMSVWYLLAGLPLGPLFSPSPWLMLGGLLSLASIAALYVAIRRGPIGVASPIVATHPALVLLVLVAGADVRPNALEWAGLALTFAGALLLSIQVENIGAMLHLERGHVRGTALIAGGCSVLFAFQVLSVQEAARSASALAAAWGSRVFAILALLFCLPFSAKRPASGRHGWKFAGAQGLLDAAAVLAIASGSSGTDRAIVPVVASSFTVVTVLLARLVLKERVAALQWAAIGLILLGVGVLGLRE